MSGSPSGGGGGGGEGGVEEVVGRRRRAGDPSSSRRRSADAIWPEHFVEAVAVRIAVDAARAGGRLAAAPAIVPVFQVCSTWRAVSRSELMWQDLVHQVWSRRGPPLFPTWRDEFARLHRAGRNFRRRRHSHTILVAPFGHACCRIALSDRHLAAGFLDGSVRLFDLPAGGYLAAFPPSPSTFHLGRFSQSISGIVILASPDRLVFASQGGDVHVAVLDGPVPGAARRALAGNLVEDGPLVDFTGDERWWVGLFAGVPGRSWRVWDPATEELLYVGGGLTDADSVVGWHMLTESNGPRVGRVRIAEPGAAMGCTSSRIQVMDLIDDLGFVRNELQLRRGAAVNSVDARDGRVMVVDLRGMAVVRWARTLEEVSRFSTVRRGEGQLVLGAAGPMVVGCMNWGYAVVYVATTGGGGGGFRVWDVMTGEYLYSFRERIGEIGVVAASEQFVAAWADDTGLHLWDFGP